MTIILTLLLLLPSSALAALDPFLLGPLVPCDGVEKLCSACKLVELAQNILHFVVGFTVLMSGVIFAIAGFKMVTSAGNSGAISQAKEMFTNVVVGLVILFSAWLIVDTVLKVLLPTNNGVAVISGYGPWHQIQCVAQPMPTKQPATSSTQTPSTQTPSTQTPTAGGLTHANAVSQLGVPVVSSGNCTDKTSRSCTSLEGLQQNALIEIKNTIGSCTGCNLQITAGTEVGHTNSCHVSGTCVDIKCAGGCSPTQINTLISSASGSGAKAVWEVSSESRKNELVNSGVPSSNILVWPQITGEHASLYTQI